MNPSQMPEPSHRQASGCDCGFQSLKSPTTETRAALGAQTANCVPFLPSFHHVGAELVVEAEVVALLEEVDVVVGQEAEIRQHRGLILHEAYP